MNSNFSIFALNKHFEAERLVVEAKKVNSNVVLVNWADIKIEITNNSGMMLRVFEKQLSDIKWAVFRVGSARTVEEESRVTQMYVIAEWLVKKGVRVLNGDAIIKRSSWNKLWQMYMLNKAGVPVIDTETFGSFKSITEKYFIQEKIVKGLVGAAGKQVWKVKNLEDARLVVEPTGIGTRIFQPYHPGAVDYRVIVLGDECVGAIKRTAQKDEFRSNVSLGADAEGVDVTPTMKNLALSAAGALGIEYGGIDLYPVEGQLRVLEVNRFCQFQGFEKATGINVAKKIVEYLVNKK